MARAGARASPCLASPEVRCRGGTMEAALSDFLNHAPVFLRRRDGEIVYWTEGCRALFGFTAAEALGRNAHDLLMTRFPEPRKAVEATLAARGEWSGRLRHVTSDGGELW